MATRPEVDWEAIERRWWEQFPASEHGAELMVISLLRLPAIADEFEWPAITEINRQVKIGRAIADIVVRHAVLSVTLIEVKAEGRGLRDYCCGIGQLAYQAIMAISDFQTLSVRRVLAMPGQFPPDVALACISADVEMFPMPTQKQWIGFLCDAEAEQLAA